MYELLLQNETRKSIMKGRVNGRNNPRKLDCNDGGKRKYV